MRPRGVRNQAALCKYLGLNADSSTSSRTAVPAGRKRAGAKVCHLFHDTVHAMNIRRIVDLVEELAADHPHITVAVGKVRGVGRNADDPVRFGGGHDTNAVEFDVAAHLRHHTHSAAVMQSQILDQYAP